MGNPSNLPPLEPPSSVSASPVIASAASLQQIGRKVNDAFREDAQAQIDLMATAQDAQAKSEEREIAIGYLGKSENPVLLTIVAKQLLSPSPRIRTAAFYSLPAKIRPEGYDYTSQPSEATTALIAKLLEKIQ